jgi:hypothetical protein
LRQSTRSGSELILLSARKHLEYLLKSFYPNIFQSFLSPCALINPFWGHLKNGISKAATQHIYIYFLAIAKTESKLLITVFIQGRKSIIPVIEKH